MLKQDLFVNIMQHQRIDLSLAYRVIKPEIDLTANYQGTWKPGWKRKKNCTLEFILLLQLRYLQTVK